MNDTFISASYSTFVNKGAMALLIGSGVSRESEIPTGWDVTLDLIRQIGVMNGEKVLEDPEAWYKEKFGINPDYSLLLERLTNSSEERINLLKHYFEPTAEQVEESIRVPSQAHKYIAKLVQDGYVRVIITTNFDRLIENALKEIGIEPVIISNPNYIESVMPLMHSKITIIKLNGDYLDTGFLNLKGELSKYDDRYEPLMSQVFENFGLISCGWSGLWDTALVDSLKSHNKFRFTNFFTYRSEPSDPLRSISEYRKGYLVPIDNASFFFKELYENVAALDQLGNRHPLTEQLAIQRAKKYVASPESRVQLADLTLDLSTSTLESIKFDFSRAPTSQSIIENLEMCLSRIRPLSAMLAQVVYWSDENHFQTWKNVELMALEIPQRFNNNSWSDWDGISKVPAVILRYSIGIAYVAAKKWTLLRSLHEITAKQSYQKKNILKLTDPEVAIKSGHFHSTGYKFKTPVSKKLYEYFSPLFAPILPTNELYTDAFDMYEIISALMYMKNMEHDLGHGPLGRFCHSNRELFNEVKTQSETQQEDFYMISNQLFSSYEEFKTILTSYEEVAFKAAMFL
jgi:hypothetical protein